MKPIDPTTLAENRTGPPAGRFTLKEKEESRPGIGASARTPV